MANDVLGPQAHFSTTQQSFQAHLAEKTNLWCSEIYTFFQNFNKNIIQREVCKVTSAKIPFRGQLRSTLRHPRQHNLSYRVTVMKLARP